MYKHWNAKNNIDQKGDVLCYNTDRQDGAFF